MLEKIVGNEEFVSCVSAAMHAGRLAHSLLICGEEGTGADYAAKCLAADYLYPDGGEGARLVMENAAGEYVRIDGEGASGDIKIERIRNIRKEVFSTTLCATGRAVHIAGAQKMGAPSANALLKVLEEPPENVVFILTAPSEAAVLPTIRSRCCMYTLSPVSREECAAYIAKNFPMHKNKAERLSDIFGGKIGLCVKCLSDTHIQNHLNDAEKLFSLAQNGDEYAASALLSSYEKDKDGAKNMLAMFAQVCAAALKQPDLKNADCAVRCIEAAGTALSQISSNVNQKLVLCVLGAHIVQA